MSKNDDVQTIKAMCHEVQAWTDRQPRESTVAIAASNIADELLRRIAADESTMAMRAKAIDEAFMNSLGYHDKLGMRYEKVFWITEYIAVRMFAAQGGRWDVDIVCGTATNKHPTRGSIFDLRHSLGVAPKGGV